MTRRPATGWVLLPVLLLLGGCVGTAQNEDISAAKTPAKTAQSSEFAQVSAPSPKYHYHAREPVIGAYITTDGQPTALADGWATNPTGTEHIWYANGEETSELVISSTKTVRRIVWVLPDGSQRVQVGDLTYYDPETGTYE